ncbi:MAG: hypothetical protein ACRCX2_04395 [Paraclostridium sp.]
MELNYKEREIDTFDFNYGMMSLNAFLEVHTEGCQRDIRFWQDKLKEAQETDNYYMDMFCKCQIEKYEYGIKLLEGIGENIQEGLISKICERN